MTQPTFSTILISYNQQQTIVEAASSVLQSMCDADELICVDDGSLDDTPTLLAALARDDARVHVVLIKHSGRPAVARNAGLDIARGEWISFLDGDDLYSANRFDTVRDRLRDMSVEPNVIFHNHRVFMDGDAPEAGHLRITPELERAMADQLLRASASPSSGNMWNVEGDQLAVFLLAERFVMQTSSFCVQRALVHQRGLRFTAHRVFGEDNLFMLECVLGSRVVYLPDALTSYRKHWGSLTAALTPAGHAEQLRSFQEQLELVSQRAGDILTLAERRKIQRSMYESTLHHGYLLERDGRSAEAARWYLRAAATYRRAWSALLAAKALVRTPREYRQELLVDGKRTK